ncbi:MAG: hypothetical protein ACYTDX_06805 [Planctomycetota bacterium]|jgi:hypothetical protein
MKTLRAATLAVLTLPLSGCVFAIGNDALGDEDVVERLDSIEERLDRLEHGNRRRVRVIKGDGHVILEERNLESGEIEIEEIEMEVIEEEPVRER